MKDTPQTQTEIAPLLITIEETMCLLRLGRNKVFSLIKREGLPVQRFGRRVLIDPEELKNWLKKRQETSNL